MDCIFKFALNFRPQSIFLRDRGEAFVIVRVTSAPSFMPALYPTRDPGVYLKI